jgi:hypothetical protein
LKNVQVPDPMVNWPNIGIEIIWWHPALKNSWGEPCNIKEVIKFFFQFLEILTY